MDSTTWKISSGFKNCYLWVHLFVFFFQAGAWDSGFLKAHGKEAGVIRSLEEPILLTSRDFWVPSGTPAVGGGGVQVATCCVPSCAECRSSSWDILGAEGEIVPGTWGW